MQDWTLQGRCFVAGCLFVFILGLKFALCPGTVFINLLRFKKPQSFLQTKSRAYFTPLVSWTLTWTGQWTGPSFSSFIPVWRT